MISLVIFLLSLLSYCQGQELVADNGAACTSSRAPEGKCTSLTPENVGTCGYDEQGNYQVCCPTNNARDGQCMAPTEGIVNSLGTETRKLLVNFLEQPGSEKILLEILKQRLMDQSLSTAANCQKLRNLGMYTSGVYTITPEGFPGGVTVLCDQNTDGGGWTVIFQRKKQTSQLDFARTFEEYAAGFGEHTTEHWIGNRILHSMTGNEPFTLRVEAKSLDGERLFGVWEYFSVASEFTQFTLSVRDYSTNSTLGDGMTSSNPLDTSDNQKFSTFDRDNDGLSDGSCSEGWGKGGWWYNACFGANPTAPFQATYAVWAYWKKTISARSTTDLSEIQFKIRPPQK